jgi:hypothetical protein
MLASVPSIAFWSVTMGLRCGGGPWSDWACRAPRSGGSWTEPCLGFGPVEAEPQGIQLAFDQVGNGSNGVPLVDVTTLPETWPMISKFTKGVIVGSLVSGAAHSRRAQPARPVEEEAPTEGYATWIVMAIIMTGMDVIWFLLFWSIGFLDFMGVVWFLCTMVILVLGIREANENLRR